MAVFSCLDGFSTDYKSAAERRASEIARRCTEEK